MCGETKGLEEFAKAQRSRRDHAVKQPLYTLDFGGANLLSGQKCMKCMQEQLDMEPIDESKYDNPEAAVISESDSYYVNYELGGSVASEKESGAEEWGSGTLNLRIFPTGQPPTTILKMSLIHLPPMSIASSEDHLPSVALIQKATATLAVRQAMHPPRPDPHCPLLQM